MKKVSLWFALIFLLSAFSAAQAGVLGTSGDYNAFIYGDMNVWTTDSQGRMAAGGDISMSNYSVGSLADPAAYSLVGGGDISFGPGSIQNGGMFADGNIQLSNYGIYGDVTANGTISYNTGGTITGSATQNAGAANPVDFDVEFDYLKWLSGSLSSTAANGTTVVTTWNAITLTGTEQVNYFNLDGSNLNNATSLTFNIGSDDIAIVNVSGTSEDFSGFGIFGWEGKQSNILYNFYEATDLSIHNIGVKGSIIAPNANVNFNSGHIDGTLIADSLTGTGEFHQYEFDHDVPVVPEPVSSTLYIIGGATLGFRSLRKKKRTD